MCRQTGSCREDDRRPEHCDSAGKTTGRLAPQRGIRWRDALPAAAVTTGLFAVGRYLIALYLARTGVASAYGAALQLWTYVQMPAMAIGAACSSMAWRRASAALCGCCPSYSPTLPAVCASSSVLTAASSTT